MNVSGGEIKADPATPVSAPVAPQPRAPLRWTLPGFAPMTRIDCSFGRVHAAALRERDLVRTRTGFRPVVWLDRIQLAPDFLDLHPDAQPVLVSAGTFGRGRPKANVVLSPGQPIAAAPGGPVRPTPARDFLNRPGVFRRPESSLVYTIFDLGEPVEVCAENLWFAVAPIQLADVPRL